MVFQYQFLSIAQVRDMSIVTATPKVAPCDIAEWNVLLNGNEGGNNFVVFHVTSVICST